MRHRGARGGRDGAARPASRWAQSGLAVILAAVCLLAASAAPAGARPRSPRAAMTITVVLKRTDQSGFNRYLKQVYDRSSPHYDRFLTQAQLARRFGPSRQVYDQLRSWMRSRGLRITQGTANRLSVTARGTRQAAQRAFATPIRGQRVGRRIMYANLRPGVVPGPLGHHVQDVLGLSNRVLPVAAPADQHLCQNASSLAATAGNAAFLQTCVNLCAYSLLKGSGTGLPGVIGNVFQAIIGQLTILAGTAVNALILSPYCVGVGITQSNPGFGNWVSGHRGLFGLVSRRSGRARGQVTGAGPAQKIGLLEYDTYRASDVADWLNLLDLKPGIASHLSQVNVNGGVATPGAGQSEALVDIDTGLASAPLSNVVVYDAPPTTSFVQMFQAMIADGDTVISNSWTQCEDETSLADAQAIDSVLATAAASGITVVNGSGDGGSTCLDGSANTIGVPADSPHATAVGGTTPAFGPGLTYGSESWWNGESENPSSGAGGFGTSRYFAAPSYQSGLTGSSMRSIPDLSFTANPRAGISICQADTGGCPDGELWGGTSMAAPAVAALVADLNQELGHNVGELNAALYPLASTGAFHTAASMGSDFAHVGLGSPLFGTIEQQLAGTPTGAVSASTSSAGSAGQPQADGTQQGVVRVDLADADGNPVSGKTVTLTPSAGSSAVVSPASASTDATDGAAVFTVTDTAAELVTFTATDTTDGITLTTNPALTFTAPVAAGAQVSGGPSTVPNDGTSQATITAYLQNGLGRPASGKTITLGQGGGHAVITPAGSSTPGNTATTDAAGNATFSATDTSVESIDFTAIDTTDGNLPLPGSVIVNFATGAATCGTALPTASSGFGVSAFATGFAYASQAVVYPNNFTVPACTATDSAPAFDASGNAYIADAATGTINVIGPSGGAASPANQLPDANFPGGSLGQLAFTKNGSLFAGLNQSGGSYQNPEIVQLDPATGATLRIVANSAGGLPDCPAVIVADPLSGDLITDDECNGAATNNQISRIHDPSGPHPTVTNYLTTAGCNLGMAAAPDGTLYLADCNPAEIDRIGATNTSNPTATRVVSLSSTPSAVAVTGVDASGHATQLEAFAFDGSVTAIDLTQSPATVTPAATGSSPFSLTALGVGACGYSAIPGSVVTIGQSPACGAATTTAPAIALTQSTGSSSPVTGSSVGFTATLQNVSGAAGIPVHFAVSGPNAGPHLADADGSGQAASSYSGALTGVDTVTAYAVLNGAQVTSAPLLVHWTAGRDASALSLNTSHGAGGLGQPVALRATLEDVSQSPVVPIGGASVTLSVGSASCTTTTDGSGVAACSVTPPGGVGLQAMAASYAGDASHAAASASDVFLLGAVGLGGASAPPPAPPVSGGVPVNTAPPVLSGTPTPGNRLSCSQGSWSGSPTAFAYQWERGGKVIAGATSARYVVQIVDEALRLSCAVTASNARGAGAAAHSASVLVAIKGTTGCTRPSGRLKGATIGQLTLGLSRKAARGKLRRFGVTHNDFDNFCLYGGWGIRAGYPSAKLVRSLPAKQRERVTGIVLLSTANPFYALDGVKPGSKLTKQVRRRLHLGKAFRIGKNDWYIVSGAKADGVLKVRGSVIQEVGVADKGLLGARAAQRRFLTSFSNT
jgi:hypothetical protein